MGEYVGIPTMTGAGCGYSVSIDQPSCSAPTAMHVLVDSVAWGVTSLEACAAHILRAREAAPVLDEHPYGPACADEGACCWCGGEVHTDG